jgi:signal transduction histidine kinase
MRDEDKTNEQLLSELRQYREEYNKFAYIVSHDLRTPLINLKGFTAELRSAVETIRSVLQPLLPQLGDEQRSTVATAIEVDIPEALGFIEFSVARIDDFMSAVLRLSRLNRRELRFQLVDMEALVREVLETLSDEVEQRRATIAISSPLPEIVADWASMSEVLQILLRNAVVYLDPGRPGEIVVAGKRGSDETTFSVRDNGRGIAESDLPKIFEPFRRGGKQDVPGEGMGLVYAQTLIRHHGGRIECTSELGVGTEFTFAVSDHLAEGGSHAQ